MSHHCQACVVTCEDYRLHRRADGRNVIGDFVASLGGDCDVITRGGGIQDLVRPAKGVGKSLLRDLGVSVELHGVKTICLVNHTTCGAYESFGFESLQAEAAQHIEDLHAVQKLLAERFPGVTIRLFLAEPEPGNDDNFTIRPLDESF